MSFETDRADELREQGFSKDGKHNQPQVVLGLLVSKDGYSLSYSVFKGSQYEGRTMIPVIEDFSANVSVSINQDKIREDEKWDGLKGYITNTTLAAVEVYEQYRALWVIERAYRITKGTLEMRPMFHFTPRRIEAHVCICFVAYKVYKELERVLKLARIQMSVDKVLGISKPITTLNINMPVSGKTMIKTMLLTPKHKAIEKIFDKNFWKNF